MMIIAPILVLVAGAMGRFMIGVMIMTGSGAMLMSRSRRKCVLNP